MIILYGQPKWSFALPFMFHKFVREGAKVWGALRGGGTFNKHIEYKVEVKWSFPDNGEGGGLGRGYICLKFS